MKIRIGLVFLLSTASLISKAEIKKNDVIYLRNNWQIQSSANLSQNGKIISSVSWKADQWYPASVPSTVLGTLVDNKVFDNPYYGTNIEKIPGFYRGIRKEMPENSPFRVPWWYRTIFHLPVHFTNKHTWIKFHSINYKANIWMNGRLVADTSEIQGAYRIFDLDITKYAKSGDENCLALEIFPPKDHDLSITWVDWNPIPPDKATGIWYDVTIESTGSVAILHPHVITDLDLPSAKSAKLTVTAELRNTEDKPVKGILRGFVENLNFSQEVNLNANETKLVTFTPEKFDQLNIRNPRLWWPHTVGPQNLYNLDLTFKTGGMLSDSLHARFGVRKITSWMNTFDKKRTRVFQINGKNIVIRGGGYVQDMMMRPSKERVDADIAYAKHMNLNTLRMEAPRGDDYFFEKCDEEGILLMVGWCCCSIWEDWKKWTPQITNIAELSWRDQIVHLRNHPSVFLWLYGSDLYPPANIEKRYLKVLDECDQTRPYLSSATQAASEIAGHTGVYMGPYPKGYAYGTPSSWYKRTEFNTEAGPSGEQIAPMESMRKMMPEKEIWPVSNSWNLRLHKVFYPPMREALFSRYGKPESAEEYSTKSQVLQLEATRAMFEAYAGNKYRSSGIIYWMYNSAWPTLYWQLYDYYLAPNGAFYGTKKACEPLHIQYSYADSSIYVVNGIYQEFSGLKASLKMYDMNMKERISKEADFNIGSDEVKKVIEFTKPKNLTNIYFLKLELKDASGKILSNNFYWLSLRGDEKADFKNLDKLPGVGLKCRIVNMKKEGNRMVLDLEIENPSSKLAFSVNPKIISKKTKDMVLPVFWEDNYFSLLPYEKRMLKVQVGLKQFNGEDALLKIEGWNIQELSMDIDKSSAGTNIKWKKASKDQKNL
jgi:exo-1,4-beta-D-glucosaminidase